MGALTAPLARFVGLLRPSREAWEALEEGRGSLVSARREEGREGVVVLSEEDEGDLGRREDCREEGRVVEGFLGVVEGVWGRANDIWRWGEENSDEGGKQEMRRATTTTIPAALHSLSTVQGVDGLKSPYEPKQPNLTNFPHFFLPLLPANSRKMNMHNTALRPLPRTV